jgi:DNA-binding SARP family transcriptional activator/tetratricopeptide (TPR) repeat protein
VLLRLHVLGRVAVDLPGRPVALTKLEATLLAALACSASGAASSDLLADWLWDDDLPSQPRNRVQALVSGLRRKTAPTPILTTTTDGYRLDTEVATDLPHWRALARRATDTASISARRRLLHRALEDADAEPLGGCVPSSRVLATRSHITEERLRLLGQRIDADITAGALEGLTAELTALVEEHPFHEGFTAQLITVLGLVGRQGDAVAVYHRVRVQLGRELGVRPGPILERAYAALIGEAPALPPLTPLPRRPDRDTAVPRTVPRSVSVVVGRDAELLLIREAATTAREHPPVVAITGLGGMGKSTLAIEAAHQLRAAFPGGSLHVELSGELGQAGPSAVLEHFLGVLAVQRSSIPPRLADRAAVFRSILDARRVLVVLDDVPDGYDVSTLLPARPTSMAILTSRTPIKGVVVSHPVRLGYLDEDASLEALRTQLGAPRVDATPEAASALVALCGGHPLLLRVVGQRLARRPDLSLGLAAAQLTDEFSGHRELTDDDGRLQAGLGLAETPLPPSSRALLHTLARLPFRRISRHTCRAVLGDALTADAALDGLVDAGVLHPVLRDGSDPLYGLHDLLRLHIRRTSKDPEPDLPRIAADLLSIACRYAPAYPDQTPPVDAVCRRFGQHTGEPPVTTSPPEALHYFAAETEVLISCARAVAGADPELAWRLLLVCAPAAKRQIDLWLAAERDVRADLPDRGAGQLGQAYLDLAAAGILVEGDLGPERLDPLVSAREALLRSGDVAGAVEAAIISARQNQLLGRRAQVVSDLLWASAHVQDAGPATVPGHLALAWGCFHDAYDELTEAQQAHSQAVELLSRTNDWAGLALAQLELAHAFRRTGGSATALAWCQAAMASYARLHDPRRSTICVDALADILVRLGHPDEALGHAREAMALAAEHLDEYALHRAERTLSRALAGLGRLDEAEAALRSSAAGFSAMGRPIGQAGTLRDLSRLLGEQDRWDEALLTLQAEKTLLIDAGAVDLSVLEGLIGVARSHLPPPALAPRNFRSEIAAPR